MAWPSSPFGGQSVTHVSGTFCYLCLGTVLLKRSCCINKLTLSPGMCRQKDPAGRSVSWIARPGDHESECEHRFLLKSETVKPDRVRPPETLFRKEIQITAIDADCFIRRFRRVALCYKSVSQTLRQLIPILAPKIGKYRGRENHANERLGTFRISLWQFKSLDSIFGDAKAIARSFQPAVILESSHHGFRCPVRGALVAESSGNNLRRRGMIVFVSVEVRAMPRHSFLPSGMQAPTMKS